MKRTVITLGLISATLLVVLFLLRSPGRPFDPYTPAQSVSDAPP